MGAECAPGFLTEMDDTAKGGLTQFWELLTVIPCAPKDFKLTADCPVSQAEKVDQSDSISPHQSVNLQNIHLLHLLQNIMSFGNKQEKLCKIFPAFSVRSG